MEGEACPLPSSSRKEDPSADPVRRMLEGKRIAIVGLSDDPRRAAWMIAEYCKSVGKTVIPVNPKFDELMGLTCYPTVAAIPEPVDVVDVFRRPEYCADVVRDAIDAKAQGVWLQSGIVNS